MSRPNYLFLISFLGSVVFCEQCKVFNFERDFQDWRSESNLCAFIPETWTVKNYTENKINSPHPNSRLFISPSETVSCIVSPIMQMETDGTVEVNVYMEANSVTDDVIITVNRVNNGLNEIVAHLSLKGYVKGWITKKLVLFGTGNFSGYINLIGQASASSVILIDSLRYIPPKVQSDDDQCTIYTNEEENENSSEFTTESTTIQPEELCITYDFAENFNSLFNSEGVCQNMPSWKLGNYSSSFVKRPHEDSESFISPNKKFSCVTSFLFPVEFGGEIEVFVYMNATSSNLLTVLVFAKVDNSNDPTVAVLERTGPLENVYNSGWYSYKGRLIVPGSYNGYITFIGLNTDETVLIIDSFRYYAPSIDENSCTIYKENVDEIGVTSTTDVSQDGCLTYNFEDDFDNLFSNERLCASFDPWYFGNYSSLSIDSPNVDSTSFITPKTSFSCSTSFSFPMEVGGVIEVNVFMNATPVDVVSIMAHKVTDDATDPVVAMITRYQVKDTDCMNGWCLYRGTVLGFGNFDGYISFMGAQSSIGNIIIDSFRYIPPEADESNCIIYDNNDDETTTTEQPETCVIYNFEGNDDQYITENTCDGSDYWAQWSLGDFSSIHINNPSPNSTTFIKPSTSLSCAISSYFLTSPGGVVEVNVFMLPTSFTDHIVVFVNATFSDGDNIVLGVSIYTAYSTAFTPGWKTLRIQLPDLGRDDYPVCQVMFTGSATNNSIVLVDSFRYIPPGYSKDNDECIFYDYDKEFTSPYPSTTTTLPNTTEDTTSTEYTPTTEPDNITYTDVTTTYTDPTDPVVDSTSTTETTWTPTNTQSPTQEVTDSVSTFETTWIPTGTQSPTQEVTYSTSTTETTWIPTGTQSPTQEVTDSISTSEITWLPTGTQSPTQEVTDSTSTTETTWIATGTQSPTKEVTTPTTPEFEPIVTENATQSQITQTTSEMTTTSTPDNDLIITGSTSTTTTVKPPDTEEESEDGLDFWITICIIVIVVLVIILICACYSFCCYELGVRSSQKNMPSHISIINNTGHRDYEILKHMNAHKNTPINERNPPFIPNSDEII